MRRVSGGYTIIEVMIVLAVTGALFLAASMLFQGQQGKNEFTDSNRDLQSKLLDYANDVTTGYYPIANQAGFGNGYTCRIVDVAPTSSYTEIRRAPAGSDTFGANTGCIYIGKVIQLQPNSDQIKSYTIVGRRTVNSGGAERLVQTLQEATPTLARDTSSPSSGIDLTETYQIKWGGTVQPTLGGSNICISSLNRTCPTYTVAIYNSFGSNTTSDTGSNRIKLYSFPNFNFATAGDMNTCVSGGNTPGLPANACAISEAALSGRELNQWRICLKSATSNQYAVLRLAPGGDNLKSQITYVNSYCIGRTSPV